jgi:cytochrome c peroxidase
MNGAGDIVPRNTLPLWNRGTTGFDTFFWDGKVMKEGDKVVSQFGDRPPSSDTLVVAVHLPFVEIREMVSRTDDVADTLEREDVSVAGEVFETLASRIRDDAALGTELSNARGKLLNSLEFEDVAIAIAAFIRDDFAVESTAFHDFVFEESSLSDEAIAGGLLFYGKGQCSSCHSGPLMSDLKFHVIPLPQAGFGKNGFGVDLGRYNATRRASDKYQFRTPPLINVTKTAPYGHSGSVKSLRDLIRTHVDPLVNYDGGQRTPMQRREDVQRLRLWSASEVEALSKQEIDALVIFLGSLDSTP